MPKTSDQTKFGLAFSVGTAMVASVGGGSLLGSWLDQWFGTEPRLTIAGVVLGTVGAFTWLYRIMQKLD